MTMFCTAFAFCPRAETATIDAARFGDDLDLRCFSNPDELLAALDSAPGQLLLVEGDADPDAARALVRRVRELAPAMQPAILALGAEPAGLLAAGADDALEPAAGREVARARLRNLLRLRQAEREPDDDWRLDMMVKSALLMTNERDRTRLMGNILTQLRLLLNCDGGTLYLVTERRTLQFAQRTLDDALPSSEIPLDDPVSGAPNARYASVWAALNRRSVIIDDVYAETRFDLSGTRAFDQATGRHTVSMLVVPMVPRGADVVGVLQFFNARDPRSGAVVPFAPHLLGFVEALAAQAGVALDNLLLVDAQKRLLEDMIEVLAGAIDAKSPYTGGHCSRVPELALMVARVAHDVEHGALAHFRFDTEEQWREFRIGAWLHDCGKVTTPDFVIDKATKLETIHNRIHEVRTRFEVLLRDARIASLEAQLRGEPAAACDAAFEQRRRELTDDFAFVATCNIGGEAIDNAALERLQRIAQVGWMRHFDARLGLSRAELEALGAAGPQALPTPETLLLDRACDRIARRPEHFPDPTLGFSMQVPELLYNRGELYNLSVSRGTLTAEERYKINEHIVQTSVMLHRMHFPRELRRVPEYACGHHETLDGRGYPRGLSEKDLSIPARILAVVDIFEALTASDRPYKEAKKLSEAVAILHRFKLDRHIDPDIFDLCLTSGVFHAYATRFLPAEQNDDFDIARYLGPCP
jgi:HD-GYP domain-containing protein (c-di-GMP phosphodiesterase class II)